jgi:AraC-like DNA-binding protein/mannose-6-phosphate isomerase-like protein (cupin superfamily)
MKPRRSPVEFTLPPHGVYVWETQHDIGFRMDTEAHPFAEIFYVLDGAGSFVIDGREHLCGPGDVVLVPPGAPHIIEDGGTPLTLYGIAVSASLLGNDPEIVRRARAGVVPGSRALGGRVRAGIRRLLYEQTDTQPGARTLMIGLTLQLAAALARVAAGPDPAHAAHPSDANRRAVERFLAELAHRFYEPVRIDRVAADLGMSRRSFTRIFRACAGCSYADYVERVRVEYACRLLRETTRGIAPIAFECGYEELSSFYRAFRRQTQTSPGVWRESGAAIPTLVACGPICEPG